MKQNSKRTLQAILEHKDYFDQRLCSGPAETAKFSPAKIANFSPPNLANK